MVAQFVLNEIALVLSQIDFNNTNWQIGAGRGILAPIYW